MTSDGKTVLTLFIVNRDLGNLNELSVKLSAFTVGEVVPHSVICGYDKNAVNSRDSEDVIPTDAPLPELADGRMSVKLNPLSWNVIEISPIN